jgi:hypothetical protein
LIDHFLPDFFLVDVEKIPKIKPENFLNLDSLLINYLEDLISQNPSQLKLKWAEQFLNHSYPCLKYYKNEPRIRYAFENLNIYPIDISKDPFEFLVKVPGITLLVAKRLCSLREKRKIDYLDITNSGGKLYIAKHFICNNGNLPKIFRKSKKENQQLELF